MVQPQYNPQEALERVKLMMKYDMSKTLNENKEVIFEQVQGCSPSLTDADLTAILEDVYQKLDLMTTTILQVAYAEERAKSVYDNVNKLIGKKYYDDITKECKVAKTEFMEQFKTRAHQGGLLFSTNGDIIEVIDEALDESGVKNSPKAQKYLNAVKKILTTEEPIPSQTGGGKKSGGKTGGGKSGYKACSGIYKMGCISDAIKQVQGCLGLVGDGKYGPKTNAKLKELGYNSFKDTDITIICNKSTQKAPEVSGEDSALDPNNL